MSEIFGHRLTMSEIFGHRLTECEAKNKHLINEIAKLTEENDILYGRTEELYRLIDYASIKRINAWFDKDGKAIRNAAS